MDSNHDKMIQNHLCYRYTTRQFINLDLNKLQHLNPGFPKTSMVQIRG